MKRQKFMSRDCYTNSRESIFVQTPSYILQENENLPHSEKKIIIVATI